MKHLLIALSLLAATPAFATESTADNGVSWDAYHTNDHFQWNNYDNAVHIAFGFTIAYVGADILQKKVGLPAVEAVIISTLSSIVIGAARETFQTYTSKTDIQTWGAGALLGGVAHYTIHF